MKSSASESKPFQSRSKGEIPGRARRNERLSRSKLKQAFLIDSDDELFMCLIQVRLMKSSASEPGLRWIPEGMEIVSAGKKEVGGKKLFEVPFSYFQYRECLKWLGYRVWRKHNSKYHQFLLFIRSTFLYHGRPGESCFQSLLAHLMNTRKVTENKIFIVKLL